ncbi:hypothetical protein A9G43_07675 [Gilliamella sp. Occ3-1]|uniref:glycosyltransferase family 2 protein n=1 Tax=Gilliamella sp. Occ3-1 TaxID=3120253 RepID=UPI00080E3EFC|nr:glycosyltransferase [Gilliamella apicola]OCG70611.1 hypothetical protein A9G43_07675 [Gilliamella apicola]
MNKQSANITVIIPCYNVELFINSCLDSLVNQSCLPKEIICINDGSTDNTGDILNRYANLYSQIKIISQPNLGVSAARNKGIAAASQEYVMFVDSDDMVNINLFHEFQSTLKHTPELEVFYFNYTSFKDEKKLPSSASQSVITSPKKYFNTGINLLNFLLENENYSGVTWLYIFKRCLFKVNFTGRIHEDHKVSLTILKNAQISCYFMNKLAYMHRNRLFSLSNQYIDYYNTCILKKVLLDCFETIKKLPISSNAKNNYFFRMNETYLELLLNSNNNYSTLERESIKKELGLLKITIRMHKNNKRRIIQNICYTFKFSKKNKCSIGTKLVLLKYAISRKHPYINTNKEHFYYSTLSQF